MKRRTFVKMAAGSGAAIVIAPTIIRPRSVYQPAPDHRQLADTALETARSMGASYADIRINLYRNQWVSTREKRVQNVWASL